VLKANKAGRNVRMALLGPGDWVGEMSILEVKPRSATVHVVAPSTLVMISSMDVTRLLYQQNIEQYAIFIRNIARELSRRLRVADGLIAQSATRLARQYVKEQKRCPD
jgi:CRP-like cAMP-binding protein